MASYNTNEFKSGLKIMISGDPHNIVENEFVKPGKGQAFNRVRVRNLKTGRVVEKTFKSGESVEAADVFETAVQYLYNDGDFWHFMHPESYEQYSISKDSIGDAVFTNLAPHETFVSTAKKKYFHVGDRARDFRERIEQKAMSFVPD